MEDQQSTMWAIVEVMGHHKFAGKVSEQVFAGQGFVRVDVPALPERRDRYYTRRETPAFTKLIGAGSIYAITPCTEDVACKAADQFRSDPVECLDLTPAAKAIAAAEDTEEDDDRGF